MKSSLAGKLLKFIIIFLTIPILLMLIFYHSYLINIIEKDSINISKDHLTYINTTIRKTATAKTDLSNYMIQTNQTYYFPILSIIDKNCNIIADIDRSRVGQRYDKYDGLLKLYIKNSLIKNSTDIVHFKNEYFMVMPLLNDKDEIIAFTINDYKNFYDKQIVTVNQTFVYILFVIVFIIFISTIFTIIFSYQITNPINSLIDSTKIIAKGNLSYKIDITSDDEIGILANSFNEMVQKLKFMDDEVHDLNHNLEDKIETEVEKNRQKDKHILHQSRLAQMGEMISMIAHQWRQPLASIGSLGASLEIKAGLGKLDNDIAIEHARNISKYSQYLSSTIDDFRDFFKPIKSKKEVSLNEVVDSALNIIGRSIENKNITIVKELNSNKRFETYSNELKQVVLNLLKNAEDILIERAISDPVITIITEDNSLSIKDNGGGIDEDIIDRLFDPYFSTKMEKDGTGLGLYMSKTIIEEHCDGRLTVVNDGECALFKIEMGVS